MLLTELFKDDKRVLPWVRKSADHETASYTFPFKDGDYNVEFDQITEGWWDFQFDFYRTKHRNTEDPQGILKHGGGEFAVFATIFVIFEDFKRLKSPDGIIFSAKEPSRVKLYRRMAHRLGSTVEEEKLHDGVEFRVQL